jgi:hypothetical protein
MPWGTGRLRCGGQQVFQLLYGELCCCGALADTKVARISSARW